MATCLTTAYSLYSSKYLLFLIVKWGKMEDKKMGVMGRIFVGLMFGIP